MKFARPAAVAALVVGTLFGSAPAALAAAPGNDTYDGRTVIGSVPFSVSVDTTEATTDAEDLELNATCGAPALDASVWFEVTAAADGALLADVSSSSYTAGVLVATGGPGSRNIVACGPDTVGWSTVAGETYTLLAIDDQYDGGGNGGTLNLTVEEAPPTPIIDVTTDPVASFNPRTGTATVTGTVACDNPGDFAVVIIDMEQRVGRGSVFGSGDQEVPCDGARHKFSVLVQPFNGSFAGGKAATISIGFACGSFDCSVDYKEFTVMLKGKGATV